MSNQENALSAADSLAIIRQMATKSQQRLRHYSFAYLLWGVLIPVISFGHYAMATMELQYNYAIWLLTIPGGLFTWLYLRRRSRSAPSITPLEKIHSQFWLAYVATVTLLYAALVFSGGYYFITPMFLIVLGLTTFASSRLLRFLPLSVGAFVLIGSAGLCFFMSVWYQLLVMGGAVLLGFFLPGLALRASKQTTRG